MSSRGNTDEAKPGPLALLRATLLFAAFLALPLTLAAALLLAPTAQARLTFPEAQGLGGGGYDPQVAVDSQDRATVVWSGIQSVRLGADGSIGTVQNLGEGDSPQVAVDALGRATVVWRNFDDGVQALRLDAEGNAGAVHTLSGTAARDPQVAVHPQGRATVVWRRAGPTAGGIDSTVESVALDADGTPGEVRTLSRAGVRDPQVAVDAQGRATVVWCLTEEARGIQAVRLGADGTPTVVRTLSKTKCFDPQVALEARGRATVVWDGGKIRTVRLGANGNAGAMKTLSKTRAGTPQVAVDTRGRATVVWTRGMNTGFGGWTYRIQSVRLGAGGAPGAVQTLSRGSRTIANAVHAHRPQVAVDSKGRATVVWERECASCIGVVDIQARRLGTGGTPGATHRLSGNGLHLTPQVAVDSQDRPRVVWEREDHPIQTTRGDSR